MKSILIASLNEIYLRRVGVLQQWAMHIEYELYPGRATTEPPWCISWTFLSYLLASLVPNYGRGTKTFFFRQKLFTPISFVWNARIHFSRHLQKHVIASRNIKTLPHAKRHKLSLLFISLTIFTSLTISTSLTFITRQLFLWQ